MTFTKEKLQQLKKDAEWLSGFNNTAFENEDYASIQNLVEAATALPKYIAALEEAERALENAWKDLCWQGADPEPIKEELDKALTTIRQLAMGKE